MYGSNRVMILFFFFSVVSWWGNDFTVPVLWGLGLYLKGNELQQDDKDTKQSHLVLQIHYVLQSVLWYWSYYKPRKPLKQTFLLFFLSTDIIYHFMTFSNSLAPKFFPLWGCVFSPGPSSHILKRTKHSKKLDFSNTSCWELSEALYWDITDCSFNELSLIHCGWIIFNAELFKQ